jgi:hypothetical protein
MKISNKAFLDNANHGFAEGVRTAVAEFLQKLDMRGVEFNHDYTLSDLAEEVASATGVNLLDEEN